MIQMAWLGLTGRFLCLLPFFPYMYSISFSNARRNGFQYFLNHDNHDIIGIASPQLFHVGGSKWLRFRQANTALLGVSGALFNWRIWCLNQFFNDAGGEVALSRTDLIFVRGKRDRGARQLGEYLILAAKEE